MIASASITQNRGFQETVENNGAYIIYTGNHTVGVPRENIKHPAMREHYSQYMFGSPANYGFLRAFCDRNGNILAYVRTMKIEPNLIPGTTRLDTWYVFEEYNINLVEPFTIELYGHFSDNHTSIWRYNSEKHIYDLKVPVEFGGTREHWFQIKGDSRIVSDVNESYIGYQYPVTKTEPDEYVAKGVRAALIRKGFIVDMSSPIEDNFFPWLVRSQNSAASKS